MDEEKSLQPKNEEVAEEPVKVSEEPAKDSGEKPAVEAAAETPATEESAAEKPATEEPGPEKPARARTPRRNRHKTTVQLQINFLTLIPILLMGILFMLIGMSMFKKSAMEEMFKLLRGTAIVASEHFSSIDGYLHLEGGELYFDDERISDEQSYLDRVKDAYGIEISVIYGNNRVLTTLTDTDGKTMNGTMLADSRIVMEVFKGNIVSTEKNVIRKEQFLCVYVPLLGRDNVCGMIETAISLKQFNHMNRQFYIYIVLLTLLTIGVTFLLISFFTRQLIKRLALIRDYLEELVTKQTAEQEMNPLVYRYNDEIATLAEHATTIATSLKTVMGTDPLTGLYNRRAGRQHLKELWETSHKNFTVFTIVIGDLDFFKNVNDQYGHDVGDTVLVGVADILKKHAESEGFAVRWGGEEFLMGFTAARDETYEIVKNISKDIKRQTFYSADRKPFHMSMTFGIASFAGQENIDEVIRIADNNLYEGKHKGRDCIVS